MWTNDSNAVPPMDCSTSARATSATRYAPYSPWTGSVGRYLVERRGDFERVHRLDRQEAGPYNPTPLVVRRRISMCSTIGDFAVTRPISGKEVYGRQRLPEARIHRLALVRRQNLLSERRRRHVRRTRGQGVRDFAHELTGERHGYGDAGHRRQSAADPHLRAALLHRERRSRPVESNPRMF